MFKLFFVYPLLAFILFWLASDVQVGASLYTFEDNYISLEFPKEAWRSEETPEPWYTFYWSAESAQDELHKIKEVVVK